MLVSEGVVNRQQLDQALERQVELGGKLGENLAELGFIESEEEIIEVLGRQLNVGAMKLSQMELDPEVVGMVPVEMAQKFNAIPVDLDGNSLTVAVSDPGNIFVLDALKFVTGCEIVPVIAAESSIQKAIEKYYQLGDELAEIVKDIVDEELELVQEREGEEIPDLQVLKSAVQEAPLVKLVNGIISDAIRKGASDIHIETHEQVLRVRYRIDGTLMDMSPLPYRLKAAIVSRVKIMSELDIAERRIPQDGRIKVKMGNKNVDIRVSTLPTIFGEKVVMRILDPTNLMLDLTDLGFEKRALADFQTAIQKPYGIVLVTGPTGSGKTTSLYSAMTLINKPDVNIMTAEDPVEYHLEGINQVHVHPEIGLTFASALRAFLRQDPNIIMVGEIRDLETAEIAIRAALTGHLVLSTVHTNDAPSTINRLVDMGIQPFLVSSSLNLIVAQRLVRKICPRCKQKDEPTAELGEFLEQLGFSPQEVKNMDTFHGSGCEECHNTGFSGRLGIYEVLPMSAKMKELIVKEASIRELRKQMVQEHVLTLRDAAMEKLRQGITTVEEVIRETVGE
ncbi:type IV-A pilus assembly ATPase PilB [bacterium]|nr:type IV-A pilus assembly ATPase PilB [bacterium]